jgi:hypothetical protein
VSIVWYKVVYGANNLLVLAAYHSSYVWCTAMYYVTVHVVTINLGEGRLTAVLREPFITKRYSVIVKLWQ